MAEHRQLDQRLLTNVSQAYWCQVTEGGHATFEPARVSLDDAPREQVSWFDRLFDGGILIPGAQGRPLTMLFTGPPGSGKSTLAIELCHRAHIKDGGSPKPVSSLYVSLESESERLIDNAVRLGYIDFERRAVTYGQADPGGKVFSIWGRERMDQHLRSHREQSKNPDGSPGVGIIDLFLEALFNLPSRSVERSVTIAKNLAAKRRSPKLLDLKATKRAVSHTSPDILVIDSLNVIGADKKPRFFEDFMARVPSSAKLVIFVLDSVREGGTHPTWEFVCDNVVRTGYRSHHNYYTRSIEIVKARYQSHVWGSHQLKIYAKPSLPTEGIRNRTDQMLRGHPYRTEGGVFIFPSLHYYLSLYKRRGAAEEGRHEIPTPTSLLYIDPGCQGLEKIVTFPKGRCTAFVGARGGHKSHLGYVHLLSLIQNSKDEAALVISLREDEQRSYSTMQGILTNQNGGNIQKYRSSNQLEVVYYHPGYITPEEFFHRMFLSVQRLKAGGERGRSLTVMFNSLDQLGTKFPLCAREEGFVAGVIEALSGEHATSIFIAVDEPGQPPEQYGLLAMADLILSFYPYEFTRADYLQHVGAGMNGKHPASVLGNFTAADAKRIRHEEIVLQVVRYAGGMRAGARGILELVEPAESGKKAKPSIHKEPGLHFSPLNPLAERGTRLYERSIRVDSR
jgi:KaiC/GvpD/RAD55 family RecA-like ATPase